MFNYKKGFTLVELMVVLSIIGTLSTSVTSSLQEVRKSGRDTVRISDIQQLSLAMEIDRDITTDNYITLANTTPQAIGTDLPEVPENNNSSDGIYGWVDNTATPSQYCAWAVLEKEVNGGQFYVATPRGAGYMDEEPTDLESCVFYEEESFDTGNENEVDVAFVCHIDKKGNPKTLNVDPGNSDGHSNVAAAHLGHGDTPGECP